MHTKFSALTEEELLTHCYTCCTSSPLVMELCARLVMKLPTHEAVTLMHLMPQTLQDFFRDGLNPGK